LNTFCFIRFYRAEFYIKISKEQKISEKFAITSFAIVYLQRISQLIVEIKMIFLQGGILDFAF